MQPFPVTKSPESDDERFMLEALKQAWKAYQLGEVPVGAVLVLEGRVIARGYNQVEMLRDATAHAEMLCLTSGATAFEDWRLLNTTLYCTMEPCAMCAGAMFLSRIKRLCFGAKDIRHGACGSWVNLFEKAHPIHKIEITGGILAEESQEMLRSFFQKVRQKDE